MSTKEAQDLCLGEKMEGWRNLGVTFAGVAPWHPQTAYAVLKKSLQKEWAFVQCVTPDIGMAFQVVEYALRYIFLPALCQVSIAKIPGR